jgi:cytochrome bd-type quinol oxidase subunit 1
VKAPQVLASLVMFSLVYLLLGGLFLSTLRRLVNEGPEDENATREGWPDLFRKTGRHTRA